MKVGIRFIGDDPEAFVQRMERSFHWWENKLEVIISPDPRTSYICIKEAYPEFKDAIGPVSILERNARQCHLFEPKISIMRSEAEGFLTWWKLFIKLEEENKELKREKDEEREKRVASHIAHMEAP